MRRSLIAVIAAVLAAVPASCDGSDANAPTGKGAVAAVDRLNQAILDGDAQPMIDAVGDTCGEAVDEADVRASVLDLAEVFDIAGVETTQLQPAARLVEFDAPRARVEVGWEGGDVAVADLLGEGDLVDLRHDGDTWRFVECPLAGVAVDAAEGGEFGSSSRPAPALAPVDIGAGFIVSASGDAAVLDAENGERVEAPAQSELVRFPYSVGLVGVAEPARPSDIVVRLLGASSGTLYESVACPDDATAGIHLLVGGRFDTAACFAVLPNDLDGALLAFGSSAVAAPVYVDPFAVETPDELPAVDGPVDGAMLTPARRRPEPYGGAVAVGDDWTVEVVEVSGGDRLVIELAVGYSGDNDAVPLGFLSIAVAGDDNLLRVAEPCPTDVSPLPAQIDTGELVTGAICVSLPPRQRDSAQLFVGDGVPVGYVVIELPDVGH